MRKIMWPVVAGVIVLSFALPHRISAAMLTYVSGTMSTEALHFSGQAGVGELVDGDWVIQSINYGFPGPISASVSNSTLSYQASALASTTPSSLIFNLSTSGSIGYNPFPFPNVTAGGSDVTMGGYGQFIFFRLDSTPDDATTHGQLYYNYSWNSIVYINGSTESLFSIKINNDVKLPLTLNSYNSYTPNVVSMNGAFDIAIGDIIGIILFVGGSDDSLSFSGYESNCNAQFLLEGFNLVPLPPTVWLFGSGLLALAGWRRSRKG